MMSITCIASSPPFVSRFGGRRMGGTNGRAAAEGQHCLFPVWTPGRQFGRLDAARVPNSEGAPRLPRSASRTAPRAGNPVNRLRWTRRRLWLRPWSPYGRLDRVSRACGSGRRGFAPRAGCRRVGASLAAGAVSANRLPPPSIDRAGARCDSGGSGQLCPCPAPCLRLGAAPLRRSASAQRLRADGLPPFVARTVANPCEVSRRSRRDYRLRRWGRLPPPESVAYPWRP